MPDIDTIYLIHHSHTDIGYTNDQPVVWDLYTRFIDEALDLAERYAESSSDGAFRWTIETTSTLQAWLRYASTRDIERLQVLERSGRIEITGMFAHLTPLVDTDQLAESFQLLRTLRQDYGFTIRHTMNCDVNGVNWPFVDVLLDCGIEGHSMAINSHFGGALTPRPYPFLWQGPSGRTLPVFNGWNYDKGWHEGIGRDTHDFETVRWPRLQRYLTKIGYPLPILMLQSIHPYGDVGTAYDYTTFIDGWNKAEKSPRIVMATPSIWWDAVKSHLSELSTLRGDWTDFWNFGAISSARETAINRRSRQHLRNADAIFAALANLTDKTPWATQSFGRYREKAYWNLHFWDEHTWGADTSISQPSGEDTYSQWNHKASYAYTARSLSQLLQRDAVADLARLVARDNAGDLLVMNPLPWPHTVSGRVPNFVLEPRGLPDDSTAGRHHQDRNARLDQETGIALPPTVLEGFGYKVVQRADLIDLSKHTVVTDDATTENHRYRLTFDRTTGGITSLYDKDLEHEWVDTAAPYRLNAYVHEEVADTSHPWPRSLIFHQDRNAEVAEVPPGWNTEWQARRASTTRVLSHKVFKTPLGTTVVQELEAPGVHGVLIQRIFLPVDENFIECHSIWEMRMVDHPEATYVLFPFSLPGATVRYDAGGQPVIPEDDQLPGVCRDYFTVQNWVDFSNDALGITVTMPENPLVQLGDFHFGHYQRRFNLERPHLLGWVTNNYWETNFRAYQPGQVEARYRLYPHGGPFQEAVADRVGHEAAQSQLLMQHLGEPVGITPLPQQGALLNLPADPVQTLHLRHADSGIMVRLLNASDTAQTAVIGSALLEITKASSCDLLDTRLEPLEVTTGQTAITIEARQFAVLYLEFEVD